MDGAGAGRKENGSMEVEEKQDQPENVESMTITTDSVDVKSEATSSNDCEDVQEGAPLFRIQSEDNFELFDQEDYGDGGDEDMTDFRDLEEGRPRKRKQNFNFRENPNYVEEFQRIQDLIEEEEEQQDYLPEIPKTGAKAVAGRPPSSSRTRSNKNCHLYNLNPNDFDHDPVRKTQIKRARITHRHHQLRKWMIISQQKEIKQLRSHNQALMAKVLELRGCECEKNQDVNVDIVDKIIPRSKYPENMFPHVKWPNLEDFKILTQGQVSPPMSLKNKLFMPPFPEKTVEPEPEPARTSESPPPVLINIHSSRLASLTCKKMEAVKKEDVVMKKFPRAIPTSFSVKPRPAPTTIDTLRPVFIRRVPFASMSPKKYDNKSPATAVPASKLLCMEKLVKNANPLTFLSQSMGGPNLNYQWQAPASPTLRLINSVKAHSTVGSTDSVGRWIIQPGYQRIARKREPVPVTALGSLNEEMRKRESEKLALEQQFKALDGDEDEDDLAILATLSPQSQQRKRKKALSQQRKMYRERKKKEKVIRQLVNQQKQEVMIDGNKMKQELEERYTDIVFEEAD